jgi:hypothetical protein
VARSRSLAGSNASYGETRVLGFRLSMTSTTRVASRRVFDGKQSVDLVHTADSGPLASDVG